MMKPENAETIVNTGGSANGASSATGTTGPGNHRSHCTMSPATYVVRSAGSDGRYNGRSSATLARSTEDEFSHPIRSAITVAGISGNSARSVLILGSNAPTIDALDRRSYRGGSSAANAVRTVFRATPNRRAIALIAMPSNLCSRRISAHSSILITPSLWPRGVKIRSASGGQYWRGVDTARSQSVAG